MARGVANKNYWVLLLLVLAGVVLGGFIGELTSNISFLHWLSYGQSFGLQNAAGSRPRHSGSYVRTDNQNYHRRYHRNSTCNSHLSIIVKHLKGGIKFPDKPETLYRLYYSP